MTKTTCNICGEVIPLGTHTLPDALKGKSNIRVTDQGGPANNPERVTFYQFVFEIRVLTYQFNTTDFHLCKKCLANAALKGTIE